MSKRGSRIPDSFPGLRVDALTFEDFVRTWAATYHDPREHLYEENIGRTLTPERVLDLFTWKNGGPLSRAKEASVRRHYLARLGEAPGLPADGDVRSALALWPTGGLIWRVFWLHSQRPDHYPIFDQHAYRGVAWITRIEPAEIPSSDLEKARLYQEDFVPVIRSLPRMNRDVDRALFQFGKFLKGWRGSSREGISPSAARLSHPPDSMSAVFPLVPEPRGGVAWRAWNSFLNLIFSGPAAEA